MDFYGPLLARALFPAYEAARGRPTVPLLRYLGETERWSVDQLRDLQLGLLRRLIRHAYRHTDHYREALDQAGLTPEDFTSLAALEKLPLLDRATLRASSDTRIASAPPVAVITKTTSGSSGQPVRVSYNAESRHWRDAIRWRGYGWAGYRMGVRAMHYWGMGPPSMMSWWHKRKLALDRILKRDLYVDCTPRGEQALDEAVASIRRFRPEVMVAFPSGAAALARHVIAKNLRTWDPFPVLTGAEALLPHDREVMERAFGPAFDTYGCREVMLIGAECEAHDGLHTSMENLIVEVIVREPDGSTRGARPGEVGEVAITDLHNLSCPMIRYLNGDLATVHVDERCACGRGLAKISSIDGRVTETLSDGQGRPVGGLVFNILFGLIGHVARNFQVIQRVDRSIVFKIVPFEAIGIPEREEQLIRQHAAKYLPGAPLTIEIVDDIPLTAAGKRRVVVVEKPS